MMAAAHADRRITIEVEGPIQGEEFPSRVFCKDYEVYPDVVVSWDMPAGQALDWLWKDVTCINVTLKYDYRANKAEMTVKGGLETVREMEGKIPGFREALAAVVAHHLSPPVSVLATEMSTAKAGTKSQA